MMLRRILRGESAAAFLLAAVVGCGVADSSRGVRADSSAPPNVLLITVDDMGWDSLGVTGSTVPDISPNIDRLATQGMLFSSAHVTIAICQPTRAVWMTGRYPHRSGAFGFDPIEPGVPTLVEALSEAGYYTGLMAKTGHVVPSRLDAFDAVIAARELRNGRSPQLYYEHARQFFRRASAAGDPFFLMANSQDPHRPFAASRQETNFRARDATNPSEQYGGGFPDAELAFDPDEIPLPGYLADLPDVRLELAQYYTSVRRADATVGAVLRALDDAGAADNTLVMFLSDHGPSLPFAKANAFMHSTRTPWIVRWRGIVAAGAVDDEHLVSGIDMAPTILAAVGLENLEGADGRSFLPLLRGEPQAGFDVAITQINTLSSGRAYPMRAVNDGRYGYIFNAWSDGETTYRSEASGGLTFPAMRAATEAGSGQDAAAGGIAARPTARLLARVHHYLYRTPEELYDYDNDPDALDNLAGLPEYATTAERLRARLLAYMRSTDDPQLEVFETFLGGR